MSKDKTQELLDAAKEATPEVYEEKRKAAEDEFEKEWEVKNSKIKTITIDEISVRESLPVQVPYDVCSKMAKSSCSRCLGRGYVEMWVSGEGRNMPIKKETVRKTIQSCGCIYKSYEKLNPNQKSLIWDTCKVITKDIYMKSKGFK